MPNKGVTLSASTIVRSNLNKSGAFIAPLNEALNAVLMVRTHDRPEYWQFPGGVIDEGETPQDAAAREAQEELGLTFDKNSLWKIAEAPSDYHQGTLHCYAALADSSSPLETEWEIKEARWVEWAELPALPMAPASGKFSIELYDRMSSFMM